MSKKKIMVNESLNKTNYDNYECVNLNCEYVVAQGKGEKHRGNRQHCT